MFPLSQTHIKQILYSQRVTILVEELEQVMLFLIVPVLLCAVVIPIGYNDTRSHTLSVFSNVVVLDIIWQLKVVNELDAHLSPVAGVHIEQLAIGIVYAKFVFIFYRCKCQHISVAQCVFCRIGRHLAPIALNVVLGADMQQPEFHTDIED